MDEPSIKAKRVMSPEALEKLAIARQKANQVRSERAKMKEKEKFLKQKQEAETRLRVEEEYKVAVQSTPPVEERTKQTKVKPVRQRVPRYSSSEEEEPQQRRLVSAPDPYMQKAYTNLFG